MKLEVGMYVRYIPTQGEYTEKISKITKMENRILDMGYQLDNEKDLVFSCHFDQIIQASHNIIDLIEEGDYVNGYRVSFKGDDYKPFVQCDYPVEEGTTNHYRFYEEAIYSIVTKEQMEAMQYRIGE